MTNVLPAKDETAIVIDEDVTIDDIKSTAKTGSALLEFSKTYKPFTFPWAVELTRKHENIHWVEDEADLQEDVNQWKCGDITDHEKEHITNILRLFTQSDVAVGQNYYDQFIPKFKNNEVRNMLGSFAAREGIHQRAYALLNDTLGLPESEYHAFLEYEEMVDKFEFMMESDVNTHAGLGLALAKSVFNEGLSLSASFVMLLNFQRFGKMKGMCKITEWSMVDESLHVEGVAALFKTFVAEHPRIINDEWKTQIYEMAKEIVALEDRFIDLAYETADTFNDLDQDQVKKYIRYIGDRRLIQLGMKPIFGVDRNPLPWLAWVTGNRHTNFFETRVTDYDVAGLKGEWEYDTLISL